MIRHRSLKLLTLVSLTALPLGTVACSKGASSPTEPAFVDEPTVSASTSGLSSATDESKGRGRGGDDRADNNNGNNGKNKGKGKGKGRRGRGADDQPGDDKGGRRGGRGGGQDDNNNNNNPRTGQEFEGAVASVGGNSLTLTNGTRVIVNGQTQWIARGDLRSLNATAGAVAANRPVRAEGRGTRQADGSFVAATIKVEVDD